MLNVPPPVLMAPVCVRLPICTAPVVSISTLPPRVLIVALPVLPITTAQAVEEAHVALLL